MSAPTPQNPASVARARRKNRATRLQSRAKYATDPEEVAALPAADLKVPVPPSASAAPTILNAGVSRPASRGTYRYGRDWGEMTDLDIELYCFREDLSPSQGGLGRAEHFWNVAGMLWPNDGVCRKPFIRHPWAERMILEASRHTMLSVSGCSGSTKTDTFAVWAIVNWLCDMLGTKVMVTSTSLKAARRRIWGSIEDYWNAAPGPVKMMGDLVSSYGLIRVGKHTGFRASERCGIELIPGEQSREKEATGKIIGIHNKRIILICDELPELSPALMHAAVSNLTNNPYCQAIGLGNPASYFDAHGLFATPVRGWKSITEDTLEWETINGYAIRFDATLSPNILAGETLYEFLPTEERLEEARQKMGERSFGFYRQWRGFFPPEGAEQTVVSDIDLVYFDTQSTAVRWLEPPVDVSGLDPGFTNDGDRSIAYFGKLGLCEDGYMALLFTEYIPLYEDMKNTSVPRNYQIVRAWKAECAKRGVLPTHAAVDVSGSPAFGDIVSSEWSREVHRVQFGGRSSMWRVGDGRATAQERYANRVTELYFELRAYMERRQIYGVCADFARELTARRYAAGSGGAGSREATVVLEPKRKYKGRTSKSPDIADAAMVLFDLCRARLKFKPAKPGKGKRRAVAGGAAPPSPAAGPRSHREEALQLLTEEERRAEKQRRFRTAGLVREGGFSGLAGRRTNSLIRTTFGGLRSFR